MYFQTQKVDPRNQINDLSNDEWLKRSSSIMLTPEQKTTFLKYYPQLMQLRIAIYRMLGIEMGKRSLVILFHLSPFIPLSNRISIHFDIQDLLMCGKLSTTSECLAKRENWYWTLWRGPGTPYQPVTKPDGIVPALS